jgi:alkylation response protein AidB-like acyl-CoA dehydrogenase
VELTFDAEQLELGRVVRSFLERRSDEAAVRRLMVTDSGFDEGVWRQLAGELGLLGLSVPERYGGSGYGLRELGVVFEETGRALLCAPFFATAALAVPALLASGDASACERYLPGIVAGDTIATLALTEESVRWDASGVSLLASLSGDDWTLTGTKTNVLDGLVAQLVLVAARTPDGVRLFAVDGSAPGLTKTSLDTLDQTRKQARLDFVDVPARLLGVDGDGWAAVRLALEQAAVLLACEQVGGAQRVLDMSVEYATLRLQFGRPIGSFQAIKHRCADMLVAVEQARSVAYYGVWAADTDPGELPLAASMAKVCASEAFVQCARDTIQIHGGVGFTWEHPAHLYLKRALSSELVLGSPAYHRQLLAQRIGV